MLGDRSLSVSQSGIGDSRYWSSCECFLMFMTILKEQVSVACLFIQLRASTYRVWDTCGRNWCMLGPGQIWFRILEFGPLWMMMVMLEFPQSAGIRCRVFHTCMKVISYVFGPQTTCAAYSLDCTVWYDGEGLFSDVGQHNVAASY